MNALTLYIVDRGSADGPETDIFTDLQLAEEWAEYIGAGVREENTIDRETLDAMKATREPEEKPEYRPKTGARCACKPGVQRDNCPACEGTGWRIDFAAIRGRS